MLNRLCCMRLNTAGVVIGWIGAVGSLLAVAILSVGLAQVDEIAKWIVEEWKSKEPNLDVNSVINGLTFVLIAYLVITVINLIASALLILGTVKERHLLLVPWLINSGLSLLFSSIYTVYVFFAQISMSVAFGPLIVWLIFAAFGLSLQFLIWYAIYSLFKELQANREQQQQLLRPAGASYPSYMKA